MQTIWIDASNGKYPVHIGAGLMQNPELFAPLPFSRALIVTDENVAAHFAMRLGRTLTQAGKRTETVVLPAGEQTKCPERLLELMNRLLAGEYTRADAVIALGGGVIGDLAGFAAACYMRGMGFIQMPTTLLSQIDSSVGGKTGVNLPGGKNMMGAFYQPMAVFADMDALATLPERQLAAGMAEAIKYAAIRDAALEEAIRSRDLARLVARSVEIKAEYVMDDPLDHGCRAQLNFGHTLGHAVETLSHYSVLHGEGVAIGMALMAKVGERLGVTEAGAAARIQALAYLGAALREAGDVGPVSVALHDKKRKGDHIQAVLLKTFGEAFCMALSPQELQAQLEAVC